MSIKRNKKYSSVFICCLLLFTTIIITTSTAIYASSKSNSNIIIHYKGELDEPNIYYWNSLPNNMETDWPGNEMEEEKDDWYSYEFKGVNKINFLFNKDSDQTEEFTKKSGEWWFLDGKWYSKNPEIKDDEEEPDKDKDEDEDVDVIPAIGGDFRDETIYFVMTTRFFDGYKENNVHALDDEVAGNPDSDPAWRGDFQGLIEKLDYIKALGFSAVWVTPVFENASGYDFHGYHALDFRKVDPRLETKGATYQDLINACHEKDMKIIQDVVFNHTSNNGENGLFPMMEQEYVLDKGVTGNYTKMIKNDVNEVLPADYDSLLPTPKYLARDSAMKAGDFIYRKKVDMGWEDFGVTTGQFAGDCMELNTENPVVYNYLTDTYNDYIDMGVDAFRIDTVKHISRLTFNEVFLPRFKEQAAKNGNENFYMFGEIASRVSEVFNHGVPQVSPPYYTWLDEGKYPWNFDSVDGKDNLALAEQAYNASAGRENQPTSKNAMLDGNNYHKPDYSKNSGMGVIDYTMHFNFEFANKAFNIAKEGDPYMNDSTWNVTYVDSHDYGPAIDGNDEHRFAGGTEAWAENLNLMFTFRGIPCLYYGSEIEFMAGARTDVGNTAPLSTVGRAYYGDNIEGTVEATDFSKYTASGTVAETLNHPLAKHIQRLNQIRRAIPALRRGQYSTENCDGNMAYKRRYTDSETDSFVLVALSGGATFTDVPNGKYTDAITGDVQTVSNGTLSTGDISKSNMRVYVLDTDKTKAPGKVGEDGKFLK